MERCNHGQAMKLGVKHPCKTNRKRRMDMHQVYPALDDLGVKQRIQCRSGEVVVKRRQGN